jgi:Skp family chaperone for outer membrane proteins
MRTEYATGATGIAFVARDHNDVDEIQIGQAAMQAENTMKKRGRGRPKGATSSTLSDVRAQAAEEKRKIRDELGHKIDQLNHQLEELAASSREEIRELQEALRISEQRENFFRAALEDRLQIVADHIHKSLVDWADAELEEGQVTRRKRGRPRKTFK